MTPAILIIALLLTFVVAAALADLREKFDRVRAEDGAEKPVSNFDHGKSE